MKILPVSNYQIANNDGVRRKGQQGSAQQNLIVNRNFASIPLNLHKNQILFGRTWQQHSSRGMTLNSDGTLNFNVACYDNTKKAYIEFLKSEEGEEVNSILKKGLKVKRSHSSGDIISIKPQNNNSEIFELQRNGKVFERKNIKGISPGQYYRIITVGPDNVIEKAKDPYSKEQKHVSGWSTVHNPNNYKWNDRNWMTGKVSQRVSRMPDSGLRNINGLRIMEINIPTLTPEGTFKSAKSAIREIALKGLANTIEIMPVENCYSKQWGYDGVDKFAVNERLGTSAEFKELIDYAHKYKLNVIIDMVPNHVGPDGDTLKKVGPYESGDGDFGSKLNYEGKNNIETRDWMANAALHWADEYHADGIRFDMTKPMYMGSDFTLKQITTEMNEHFPHVVLIAEDGEGNRAKVTNKRHSEGSHEADIGKIDRQVEKIEKGQGIDRLDDIGFDSEWDFVFLHNLEKAIADSENFDVFSFDAALRKSSSRVSYAISHDEQGNLDGTSAVSKAAAKRLDLFYSIKGRTEAERGQRAAHATQYLLELYATGKIDSVSDGQWRAILEKQGITRNISKDEVKNAYKYAIEKTKLAMGTVNSFPGPKMFFQGFESGSLNYFKFFRNFSEVEYFPERFKDPAQKKEILDTRAKMKAEKGYDTSINRAYRDSMPGRIKYSGEVKNTMEKVKKFSVDSGRLVEDNPALQDGYIANTIIHDKSVVHAVHAKKDDNEIFTVKNFVDRSYPEYGITFPEGKWVEVLNSNDGKYAGNGKYTNAGREFYGNNRDDQHITLGPNSVVYFKRVG